jgi:ABC-type branched-subunit amino acid transport system substrate-binding protein
MIHQTERRPRHYRRHAIPALLIAGALVLAACSSSKHTAGSSGSSSAGGSGATSGADVKVMVIAPFTLAVAPAKANYDAIRIQANMQNAKGGINGHKITVIGCDDQTDPNVGAKCAQQAVSAHVVAVLGEFSLVSSVIWPILTAAGIPSIGLIQYGPSDQTASVAWPITPPVVLAEGSATGYLAKQKGCKAIADAQADAGPNSKVPVALNKQAAAAGGAKYVGPFLLPATGSLANAPAIAKSIADKADCANVADGENGIQLMKAILQLNPKFQFATNALSLPSDWPTQMGSGAAAVTAIGGLAPDSSTSPGVQAYLTNMKAQASGDALSDISKQAWASFYAFEQVASTITGDITAKTLTDALGKASNVATQGMTGSINYTQATPLAGITRMFSTQLFQMGAQDGKVVQTGTVDAKDYLSSS